MVEISTTLCHGVDVVEGVTETTLERDRAF